MTKPYIPFLMFLILTSLAIPFSFDFTSSDVPGWYMTIFPSYFAWGLIVMIVLLLGTIGYWLLSKRTDKITWTLFAIHFTLTIATTLYLRFPSFLLNVQWTNEEELIEAIEFRLKLVPTAWTLFIVGQISFFIYYIRTLKAKRTVI